MSTSLLIIGCGGFGREVFSIVQALNAAADWLVEGFVDDDPSPRNLAEAKLGSTVTGTVDDLARRGQPMHVIVAIGSASARQQITTRLQGAAVTYPRLVHPDATSGANVTLGEGTVVAAGARLSTNIRCGRHVQIDQNATVGHDSFLGDYCRLNPHACVSGSVVVGGGALVGANATVLEGRHVGDGAIIGAGAVVVENVRANLTVKGVPAR